MAFLMNLLAPYFFCLFYLYQSSKRTIFLLVTFSYSFRKIQHMNSWVLVNIYNQNIYFLQKTCVMCISPLILFNSIVLKIRWKRYTVWECFGSSHYLQKYKKAVWYRLYFSLLVFSYCSQNPQIIWKGFGNLLNKGWDFFIKKKFHEEIGTSDYMKSVTGQWDE